jgi:hypothetical protein
MGGPSRQVRLPYPGQNLVVICQERKSLRRPLPLGFPVPCRVRPYPSMEHQGAGQQAVWVEGETLAPAQDQTADAASTEARRTPPGQERGVRPQ